MNETFYDTGSFEVYCFCPISIINKDNSKTKKILENEEEVTEIIKTDYFLVGGFNEEARCGLLKLYMAKFDEKQEETYIEFIQDIPI